MIPDIGARGSSDADGRFTFSAVAPGEYSLSAAKPGYLDMTYGARKPGTGAKIENVALRLHRGGAISGGSSSSRRCYD